MSCDKWNTYKVFNRVHCQISSFTIIYKTHSPTCADWGALAADDVVAPALPACYQTLADRSLWSLSLYDSAIRVTVICVQQTSSGQCDRMGGVFAIILPESIMLSYPCRLHALIIQPIHNRILIVIAFLDYDYRLIQPLLLWLTNAWVDQKDGCQRSRWAADLN